MCVRRRSWPEAWALLTAPEGRFGELRGDPGGLLSSLGARLLQLPHVAAAERMAAWAAARLAISGLDAAYWRAVSPAGMQALAVGPELRLHR